MKKLNDLLNEAERMDMPEEERELDEALAEGCTYMESEADKWDQMEDSADNIRLTEEQKRQLNEAGVTPVFIIGLVLAAPSVIKMIVKAVGWVIKKIRKLFGKKEDESEAVEKIIEFTEKWHKAYIKVIEKTLQVGGVFRAANIDDKKQREMAAEVIFYTIIFGFAVYSGLASGKIIMNTLQTASTKNIEMGIVESIMTAIKSSELKEFIQHITKGG